MDRFGIFTRRVYSLWYYALLLVVVRRLLVVVSSLSFSFSLFERTIKRFLPPRRVLFCVSLFFSSFFHKKKIRGFFLSYLGFLFKKSRVLVIGFKVPRRT